MTGLLDGKAAVVTGAASGIGAAVTRLFVEEGARVLAVDLPGTAMADAFGDDENVVCLEQSVTEDGAADKIVGAAAENFDQLDILFNCAGGVGAGGEIETHDEADYDFVMDLNVRSVYRLSKAAIPMLKKSGAGRIVNIGSVRSRFSDTGAISYATSKHAVAGLTKTLACEVGKYGMTANYVEPGAIVTAITAPVLDAMPEFKDYWVKRSSVGRLGEPEDIANAVLFFASEESGYVNGAGLAVDGGVMSHN